MAGDGSGQGEDQGRERNGGGTVVVIGLVSDPGPATDAAERLAERLPGDLARTVDGDVEWEVHTVHDPLPLDEHDDIPLGSTARRLRRRQGWDFLVALTDLPRRVGTRPLLASLDTAARAGLVSVPAAGWMRSPKRVGEAVAYLIARLVHEQGGLGDGKGSAPKGVGRRPVTPSPTVRHFTSPHRESMDESLELVGVRGKVRLLLGMVRANRPWRLLPSLSSAIAAAVATSSFGVFTSSIWQLADVLPPTRLALINVFAVVAMGAWLIVYNGLWERPARARMRREAMLFNASTVCTVGLGVLCMYLLLFVVTAAEALVVIESSFMQSMLGHPVGLTDYLLISWMSSSMGTVAGALGSTFESEEAVRAAAYSRRERERRERFEEEVRESEEEGTEEDHGDEGKPESASESGHRQDGSS